MYLIDLDVYCDEYYLIYLPVYNEKYVLDVGFCHTNAQLPIIFPVIIPNMRSKR